MARTRCSVWKLEFSRKSKCVGAKVRALTVLGDCRAEIPMPRLDSPETTHFFLIITLLPYSWGLQLYGAAMLVSELI